MAYFAYPRSISNRGGIQQISCSFLCVCSSGILKVSVVGYFGEHFFKQQFFYSCRRSTLALKNSTKVTCFCFFTIRPLDSFCHKFYCKIQMQNGSFGAKLGMTLGTGIF